MAKEPSRGRDRTVAASQAWSWCLNALLSGKTSLRQSATAVLGQETASIVLDALPVRRWGWRVLPVVGRRDRPAQVVGEAIEAFERTAEDAPRVWDDQQVLEALARMARQHPRAGWWAHSVYRRDGEVSRVSRLRRI